MQHHSAACPASAQVPGSGGSGLVSSYSTSGPEVIELDPRASRLKRMRRSVMSTAKLHEHAAVPGDRAWLVTLTYAKADAWGPRHVSAYAKAMRRWCQSQGAVFKNSWVAEIQPGRFLRTGEAVVHYHVLAWLPRGLTPPKPDRRGWWPWGMTQVVKARNAVGYLAKYASKGSGEAPFPRGCRLHGSGGLTVEQRQVRAFELLPWYARQAFKVHDRPVRAQGGGYVSRATGVHVESAYAFAWQGRGRPCLIRKTEAVKRMLRASRGAFVGFGRPPKPSPCAVWIDGAWDEGIPI